MFQVKTKVTAFRPKKMCKCYGIYTACVSVWNPKFGTAEILGFSEYSFHTNILKGYLFQEEIDNNIHLKKLVFLITVSMAGI